MSKSFAVIDLAYGDSGKGILVARLCATEDIDVVVRFSGGCQAAHNVITDDGRHHTFKQFGSGTFSGVPTYLSRHMMFEPFLLQEEAVDLETLGIPNPISLVSVAWDALLTTTDHAISIC
jgi:adenylosuccinate synthase